MLTNTHNLADLLAAQPELVSLLAASWHPLGATHLSLWSAGVLLAQQALHPAQPTATQPELVAPLLPDRPALGDLRVYGVQGAAAQAQIEAQAHMLGLLLSREDELEAMTSELVSNQDQLLALYDITHATRNHLSVWQTLDFLARKTTYLLRAQSGFAAFHDRQHVEVAWFPAPALDEERIGQILTRLQTAQGELMLRREHATLDDLELLPAGVSNMLLVPIRVRDTVMAAIGLLDKTNDFMAPDSKLARAIADQAGARIENLLLHTEMLDQTRLTTEMELAKQMQLNLLPQEAPRVPGLDVFAASQPALQVGGDFYDFIEEQGKPFLFTVGDIAGKGLAAAFLMAMLRTSLRSKATFMPNATPEGIIRRASADMFGDFNKLSKFATAFVGQYDRTTRELSYVNAGHAPVLYCAYGQPAVMLDASGPAMGFFSSGSWHNMRLRLAPGDMLIVGTDGFSEAQQPNREMFGFERLLALSTTLSDGTAEQVVAALFSHIAAFSAGHPQDDDQTVVVLKGVPEP